ncbi:hypothetical protein C900_03408 [Fulvivirga imtechensis AK7]|uniref:Fibronectin type-III domain-containing protein n=1 Tax=Fulvivirga imtechensis AK7 TaxID=1237149 RepID=L8JPQ4_9BACT|nr:GDSL-type esterase/lipase family protein [Fulvivirga imtechensis]ELR70800.1 hypothetical protein C900_03408 [Fulvivirga imtechensis AK7]
MSHLCKYLLILPFILLSFITLHGQGSAITWTDLVGTDVQAGNILVKTAGWGTNNGGAASSESLAEGTDGWAEFTAYATGAERYFGLTQTNTDATNLIDYAIKLSSANKIVVQENGNWRGGFGNITNGDILRIERTGSVITYKKNGVTFYTSAIPSTSSLLVDACFYHNGGQIDNAMLSFGVPLTIPAAPTDLAGTADQSGVQLSWTDSADNESGYKIERQTGGAAYELITTTTADVSSYNDHTVAPETTYTYRVAAYNAAGDSNFSNDITVNTPSLVPNSSTSITWVDLVGVSVQTDNSVLKTAGWGTNNGGAASMQTLAAGADGWAEFTAYASGAERYFGLSQSNTDATFVMNYAIKLSSTNTIVVQENGSWKGGFGRVADGDVLRIERTGNTITYKKNGSVFYTSATPSTTALLVDVCFYHTGGAINNATLSFEGSPVSLPATPTHLAGTAGSSGVHLSWVDNADNENGYSIERQTGPGDYEQIATTEADINGYIDTTTTFETTYSYRVSAFNESGTSDWSNSITITTPPAILSEQIVYLIDLGDPANPTPGNWNNVPDFQNDGIRIDNLINTQGGGSGISFVVVAEADNGHNNGSGINTDGYDQDLLGFPASACSDSYYAWGTGGTYKLTGLQAAQQYAIRIFGSRVASSGGNRVGTYTINGVTQILDARNNSTNTIIFEGLNADSIGEVTIDFGVAEGSVFGYINVLELIASSKDTTITAPDSLAATLTSATEVSLTWKDNSGNETGFDIQRSIDSGAFESIDTLAANVTAYIDDISAPGAMIRYRVRAYNSRVQSSFSNEATVYLPANSEILPRPVTNFTAEVAGEDIRLRWSDVLRVVVLGSSTAAGVGASSSDSSWVGRLTTWVHSVRPGAEVINLGKGGFTTYDVRADGSIPEPDAIRNIDAALAYDPDLIIVNLPSNNAAQNIPSDITLSHFHELKTRAEASGVKFFLTTTQPRNFSNANKRQILQDEAVQMIDQFSPLTINVYDELVNTADLRLKSVYDAGDGIHLNNSGHNYVFTAVRDHISAYLDMTVAISKSVGTPDNYEPLVNLTMADSEYLDTEVMANEITYYRLTKTNPDGSVYVITNAIVDILEFSASFESERAVDEESLFTNIAETRTVFGATSQYLLNHSNDNEVAMLSSRQSVGPGLSLRVGSGDKLDLEVYASFDGEKQYSTKQTTTALVTSIGGVLGGMSTVNTSEQMSLDALSKNHHGDMLITDARNEIWPAAYLNYIMFDKNMKPYKHGHARISQKAGSRERVALEGIVAEQAGFIYIFLSNESDYLLPVYFDDLKIKLWPYSGVRDTLERHMLKVKE